MSKRTRGTDGTNGEETKKDSDDHTKTNMLAALPSELRLYILDICGKKDAWALLHVDSWGIELLRHEDRHKWRRPSDEYIVSSGIAYVEWALAGGGSGR